MATLLLVAAIAVHAQDGSQRWAFSTLSTSTTGNIVGSPAIGPDGTVYIGIEVGSSTSTNPSGHVFAIDPSGAQKWVFTAPEWIDSTPAIAPDGTIYFGCWDGKLYALRADGSTKWSWSAGSYISGSPALAADGTIYIGTGNGNLHAVNPDGTLKWTYPTSDWIESSPAVGADGTLYFGSWNNTFYAVAPNGVLKWQYATGDDIVGSPALAADGTVYIGSRDLTLYAFDAHGVLKWAAAMGDTVEASPVIGADGTIYVATTGGRLYAFSPDGTERWRYPASGQSALNAIYSTPAIRADGAIVFGTSDNAIYALNLNGGLLWRTTLGDWADSSPVIAPDGTIYIGCSDKKLYAINGNGQPTSSTAPWPGFRQNALRTGRAPALIFTTLPASQAVGMGSGVNTMAAANPNDSGPTPSIEWQFNGAPIPMATSATLTLADFQPAHSGLYAAHFASSAAQRTTPAVMFGIFNQSKVVGDGTEFQGNILHPNGNTYDQLLLQGVAASVTADPGQVTRLSFIDLTDDIVQVEFAGAGTLSLVLDTPSGPATPANYNQNVAYMKGHAGIVIVGANETTHVSVFSVGRANAFNQGLFKDGVTYDGMATIAYLAISSFDGRIGSIRTANTSYLATKGLTGVYAPNVESLGPVYVGEITAAEAATPVLILGSAADAQINGGDLLQENARPVQVRGLTQLKFVAGTTSHGAPLPAQAIKGQLQQDQAIVTDSVATTSGP